MRDIVFCTKCLTSSARPRVAFDTQGVCNACHNQLERSAIDWNSRKSEFTALIQSMGRSNGYDCIVPWSGGKDSSSIAYKLKYEWGLNPLLVNYSPMLPTDVGMHNRSALLDAGFDCVSVTPNRRVLRILARRFFIERGNPKVAWDAGINSFPMRVSVAYRIPTVFYAEHGESEYGGRVLSEEHKKKRDLAEVLENYVGDSAENWEDSDVSLDDLAVYLYPDRDELDELGSTAYYFGYYFPWSVSDNYQYIKSKIDFRCHPGGRTPGTMTNFDSLDDKIDGIYYYMQLIKFGFGRASRDASRLIHNGVFDRETALRQASKYEEEFPGEYLEEVLEFLSLTVNEFWEIVDSHRNEEIWCRNNGGWTLRHPLR